MTGPDDGRGRFPWWLGVLGAGFLVLVGWMVVVSLRDRTPPTYRPTAVGDTAVSDTSGGRRVTLDARHPDRWISLDATTGRVHHGRPPGWDLAARRFEVVANGGPSLPGETAVALPPGRSAGAAPQEGWTVTERNEDGDLRHPLLEDWYRYDFFSHLLTPRDRTYLLRTGEGRMLELEFLSYYCPGPEAGCVTIRFRPVDDRPPDRGRRSGAGPGG